jgi:hypothetical protein
VRRKCLHEQGKEYMGFIKRLWRKVWRYIMWGSRPILTAQEMSHNYSSNIQYSIESIISTLKNEARWHHSNSYLFWDWEISQDNRQKLLDLGYIVTQKGSTLVEVSW